jgi:hypothetical protein
MRSVYPFAIFAIRNNFEEMLLQAVNSDDMFAGVLVWQERTANNRDDKCWLQIIDENSGNCVGILQNTNDRIGSVLNDILRIIRCRSVVCIDGSKWSDFTIANRI